MVWAALTIICMQGVIAFLLLRGVRSFGAFTSALIRTHDQNRLISAQNGQITEDMKTVSIRIRRAAEAVSDRSFGIPSTPPDQERSA